jgi:two-component system, chemotaxis family, CheB/CheR fusion protein
MLRNLISNALKYTKRGKIVLGVRHLSDRIRIEIHDTGIGIAPTELQAIFDEYHQVNNAARERSRGLGLGLSIVQRLGQLLGHQVDVRSVLGKGSVFSVEVMLPTGDVAPAPKKADPPVAIETHRSASILIVDDDPEVRALLELLLNDEGHTTRLAPDGRSALALLSEDQFIPDLILTDYNLPNGMDGLRLASKLREKLGAVLPVIILTGDISTATMKDVGGQKCVQLNKPVKVAELSATIQRLLAGMEQTAR